MKKKKTGSATEREKKQKGIKDEVSKNWGGSRSELWQVLYAHNVDRQRIYPVHHDKDQQMHNINCVSKFAGLWYYSNVFDTQNRIKNVKWKESDI